MAKPLPSTKRGKIDKAKATTMVVMAIAAFIVTFSLVASRGLIDKSSYQARVIKEKKVALKQVKANLQNVEQLKSSYLAFANESENVIGGNPKGNGPKDGDNARIVLDALPSKYDFPALASSLEKILKDGGFELKGITGTDDEIAQQAQAATNTPAPIEMPFPISISGSYASAQNMINLLERSIRPVQIQTISITGSDTALELNVGARTFYQPEKVLKVGSKVVK